MLGSRLRDVNQRCQPLEVSASTPGALDARPEPFIDEAPEAFSHLAQARRNGTLGARTLTGRPKVLHRSF